MAATKKPVVIELLEPIKRGEKEIGKISLREPNSGECRGVSLFDLVRMEVTTARQIVPRVSNITAPEFDTLCAKDLMKVVQEISAFFVA